MNKAMQALQRGIAAAGAAVSAAVAENRSDALMVAGAAAVSYGAWMIYAPAGYIAGGVQLIAAGVLVARGAK